MKKLLLVVLASVFSISMLTGCITITPSPTNTPIPVPSVPNVVTPSQAPGVAEFDALALVNGTSVTGADLMDLGKSVCAALDRGASFKDIVLAGSKAAGDDATLFGKVIRISVDNLCPEYTNDMQALLKAEGY